MTKDELKRLSVEFKQDAHELLEKSKLVELLAKYGKVEFTGSYAANLMMSGDIDLHLFGDFDRARAQAILDELIAETKFTGYMFFDWVEYENPQWPKGYYIGFKQIMPGYKYQWKIDIWLISEEREQSKKYSSLLQNATTEQRGIILELKHWRKADNPMLDSMVIYDAVFTVGVKNVEEFERYLADLTS